MYLKGGENQLADLQNIGDFCVVCNVPVEYASGNWSLEKCRKCCASCRSLGKSGIYKFDIVYTLHQAVQKLPPKPTGKKATAFKRYGRAVASLTAEGKSQREIADILGISPTTVCKVRAELQRQELSCGLAED